MTAVIYEPEVFGLTESSITIAYRSTLEAGTCEVLIDGTLRARDRDPGPHLHRIEGLELGPGLKSSPQALTGPQGP